MITYNVYKLKKKIETEEEAKQEIKKGSYKYMIQIIKEGPKTQFYTNNQKTNYINKKDTKNQDKHDLHQIKSIIKHNNIGITKIINIKHKKHTTHYYIQLQTTHHH